MTARADSTRVVATVALCTVAATSATAATEKVLYSFEAGADLIGRLDQDSKGVLYGAAQGLDGYGAIFRLRQKNGVWHYTTLFDFNNTDGAYPYAGPLMDRSTGVLYGTTVDGGDSGNGTVFSVAPAVRRWSENVLHGFSGSDGAYPYAGLLRDKATGNLYGTTSRGGRYGCGTAFELIESNGKWTFSTIYSFRGGSDACSPVLQLKPGAKPGTLIGGAGSGGYGQLFQLKEAHGVWSDSIVYSFTGGDGRFPTDLDATSEGTIYGVTQAGGQYGYGVVFKLAPTLKKYGYSVIYNFRGGSDGANGIGINVDGATGNLYGTTDLGGTAGGGTLFGLVPNGNTWTETVLHSFTGGANDGDVPASRPILDRTTGALYGTTQYGGANGGGTVYMVQP